ncbi:RM03-like protein [Mya arenaria]|uniref:Large ribosomal subunit protein uL3m n=1 Tax=Mya arenaria TaxID=6604 RepID=A0ABY7EUB2_MYAAR|nr:RM03-like protein [Mya arenaria]
MRKARFKNVFQREQNDHFENKSGSGMLPTTVSSKNSTNRCYKAQAGFRSDYCEIRKMTASGLGMVGQNHVTLKYFITKNTHLQIAIEKDENKRLHTGPGLAPADSGPTTNIPERKNSIDPPPAATVTRRTGVIGIKIGVIPQWKRDGTKILCQLVQVVDNHVIRYTPPEQYEKSLGFNPHWRGKGFGSVVVGALSCTPFNFTKAYTNLFLEAGVPPKRIMSRFWITPDAAVQPVWLEASKES